MRHLFLSGGQAPRAAAMARMLLAAMLSGTAAVAQAADDFKITLLEQAVRELQRQVQAQAQQIDALRRQLALPAGQSATAAVPAAGTSSAALWLEASRWQRVQTGMGELEVIGMLGPPTSMRADGAERVLLYAMEIGTSGFLSGSVTLRNRAVTAIQVPVLR